MSRNRALVEAMWLKLAAFIFDKKGPAPKAGGNELFHLAPGSIEGYGSA
jgi:hypothetical protein